jgi:hypothetical protein
MMFVASQTGDATNTPEIALATPEVAPSTITVNVTEAAVKSYFKDRPILIDIARCESTFRQFNADGTVHRGRVNNKDVGVMQINEHYHLDTATKKGIDIYTLEGNMEYARDLYDRQGSQPWISSAPCWNKAQVAAN